ncbi:glycerophosphodiester phosphodiesterase [Acutalibacter sp. 1XD8-33]|uniref:glycerophosphodiester phosphodiesterase family protein n=1 Tax=Acutalibacter sp. 1XD8-33 TaxID=2320081 RepID=UPI000EA1B9DF|nr:glycerophosphodiester phosphodiesterase family protein [Acutalibacter sp. 1XD8-33]RKJ40043.1 glycerophosphodiester phosphodiesterase [Acutalibacter sp. 1XD8-33]
MNFFRFLDVSTSGLGLPGTVALVLLGIAALAGLVWLWLIAPQLAHRPSFQEFRRFDYAHRGLHNLENGVPENSMKGFRLAELGGFGMEFDLQLTKDKRVVVHHDASIKRSCGADKAIADLTYEELRAYRLFGTEEPVPLFRDVLAGLRGTTPLIIELKGYNDPAELCQLAMKELEGYKGLYCVESFDPRIVRWFRKNRPEIVRGQLMAHFKEGDDNLTAWEAFCGRNLLTNWYTRPNFEAYDLHARDIPAMGAVKRVFGMQEVSWTIRSEEEYRRTKDLGSLCIFENILPAKAEGERQEAYARLLEAECVIVNALENR